ncbi:ATP-binding protein [Streptosporangium sp. NBC_01469]|uniref:ATP-binding protein n=1 Tax=Streptosporangium sp. NBC_01469 TaxID=2903898 RepID=UPI002E2E01FB|nr:ATP-binding protein [Streptosporangium sp. NBC_01469]
MRSADNLPPDAPDHPGIRHTTGELPGDIRLMVRALHPGSASRRARAILREVLQETGLDEDAISDAELVVAELAANAEKHARPPYELRIISVDTVPTWCEVVDGDPDLREVGIIFNLLHSVDEIGLPLLAENGRGLLLAHRLSHGHCHVYATTTFTTGAPTKAVTFALPTRPDNQHPFPTAPPYLT